MKETFGFVVAFRLAMMIAGLFMAYTAYGHSNAIIQWIHDPFATWVFGIGLGAFALGLFARAVVGNGEH